MPPHRKLSSSACFVHAWIDVLTRLWQSLESADRSDASFAAMLRLELHLLRTTAARLRVRGHLDRAQELAVDALVDDLMALAPGPALSAAERMRMQNRIFDEVVGWLRRSGAAGSEARAG